MSASTSFLGHESTISTHFSGGATEVAAPDVEAWNLEALAAGRGVAEVYVLAPTRRRWRGVVTLACAIVPLMLSTDVLAAPGVGGTLMAPASDRAEPPDLGATATAETEAEPEATTPEPVRPASAPAQPSQSESATPSPKALDETWAALVDRRLRLHMRDQSPVQCQLLGVQAGLLVCTRDSDGLVFTVDRAQVAKVYIDAPAAENKGGAKFDGTGMLVSGIIATTIGGALALATVGMTAYCLTSYYYGACPYFTLPLGVTSAAGLGAGIPLIVLGKRKRNAFREAEAASPTLTPGVSRLDSGAAGSLTLQF